MQRRLEPNSKWRKFALAHHSTGALIYILRSRMQSRTRGTAFYSNFPDLSLLLGNGVWNSLMTPWHSFWPRNLSSGFSWILMDSRELTRILMKSAPIHFLNFYFLPISASSALGLSKNIPDAGSIEIFQDFPDFQDIPRIFFSEWFSDMKIWNKIWTNSSIFYHHFHFSFLSEFPMGFQESLSICKLTSIL